MTLRITYYTNLIHTNVLFKFYSNYRWKELIAWVSVL